MLISAVRCLVQSTLVASCCVCFAGPEATRLSIQQHQVFGFLQVGAVYLPLCQSNVMLTNLPKQPCKSCLALPIQIRIAGQLARSLTGTEANTQSRS